MVCYLLNVDDENVNIDDFWKVLVFLFFKFILFEGEEVDNDMFKFVLVLICVVCDKWFLLDVFLCNVVMKFEFVLFKKWF